MAAIGESVDRAHVHPVLKSARQLVVATVARRWAALALPVGECRILVITSLAVAAEPRPLERRM